MPAILANDYTGLKLALGTAQPGDEIVLTASDYPITQLVIVPRGVTLRAHDIGVVMKYSDGLPDALKKLPPSRLSVPYSPDTHVTPSGSLRAIPVIRPGPACPIGDLVQLSDGSRIKHIKVSDLPNRSGNPIAVKARNPNQKINAEIIECVINNPGTNVVGPPEGPISRAIIITSEPGATNAKAVVTITGTRVHTPGPGSGVFAINFGSNSKIAVTINNCRIQGNLDAAGGITKIDSPAGRPGTQNSHVTIVSSDSLYEPGTTPGPTTIAWQLVGGGQVPRSDVTPGIAAGNTLVMNSDRDRIKDSWEFGVIATGGRKFYRIGGAVNQCSLTLVANDLTIAIPSPTRKADVRFSGCLAGHPEHQAAEPFSVGDGNTATITLSNTTAGGKTDNRYADAMYVSGDPLSAANAGNGNTLNFTGRRTGFIAGNSTLLPPPDNAFF